jgi:gliding motility-associated-like protein
LKTILLTCVALLFAVIVYAQETMYVPPGATVYIGKDNPVGVFGYLRNGGNISIANLGQFYFMGKIWMNEQGALMTDGSTMQNSVNGGTVRFVQPNPVFGNQGQQLFEAGYNDVLAAGVSFSNISIDNNAGVVLSSDVSILNLLQFSRGHLFSGRYTVVLGDTTAPATIKGYDENKFIVTTNGSTRGFVKYRSVANSAMATFPIGSSINTYVPLQLINYGTADDFSATSFPKVYSQATSGSVVTDSTLQATWMIAKARDENAEVLVTIQHDQPLEDAIFSANRNKSYISLFTNSGWDKPYVFAPLQTPGNISSSFPISSAFMNTRKVVMNKLPLYLSKRISKAAKSLSISNAFSPNGDNINDRWIINGLREFNCVVEVYNRLGQRVFRSVGYQQPWDGTISGKPLPVGTYYYVIDLRNGDEPLSGNITILK